MVEIPEQDRRLAVSGVGRRFGEGVGDREAVSVEGDSTFVLMAMFMRKEISVVSCFKGVAADGSSQER